MSFFINKKIIRFKRFKVLFFKDKNNFFIRFYGPLGFYDYNLDFIKYYFLNNIFLLFFFSKKYKNFFFKNFLNIKNLICYGNFLKINLVGIGYKVWFSKNLKNNFNSFFIYLGHSHFFNLNIPEYIKFFFNFKKMSFIIFSPFKKKLLDFSFLLLSLKKPDVYKNKGLVLENFFYRKKQGKSR